MARKKEKSPARAKKPHWRMQSRAARANTAADAHCLTANLDFVIVKKIYFCSFFKGKQQSSHLRIMRMFMYCAFGIKKKRKKRKNYRDIWGVFISPDGTRPRARSDFTLNLFVGTKTRQTDKISLDLIKPWQTAIL